MEPRVSEMRIGDDWVGMDGESFEVLDPATGAVHTKLPEAGAADVDRAVAAANEALHDEWGAMSGADRGRVLGRIAELLEEEGDYISELESSDNGRPRRETGAQAGVVARWYRYFAGMADKIEGRTIPVEGPYLNFTERVPVGVCAAITPWNHPLLIATKKIAPALACGNAMVVKPSELAPLSVLEFARIAEQAGLPPGALNVVTGGPAPGAALVEHPDVQRVDLTGSTATGIRIAEAAAKTLKRVGLELGGKAANIVFADADFERTVAGTVFSGFIGQGQTCVAGSRILVERPIFERFTAAVAERLAAIRIGDPQQRATQMGPLITPAAATRVAAAVAAAPGQGAEILSGGERPDGLDGELDPAGFYRPTLIGTEDHMSDIAQVELFGPVVAAIPFDSEDEAIAIANSTPFGLGSGIWTTDVIRAHRVAHELRAGITWINDYHRIDPASPWGGFGLSGYGRESGFFGVDEYTETKSVWVPRERRPMDWYDSADDARLN
jgi:(Z)-2-((N-methylformamido)methylene)-5-hydroxybutyrolactone dehydrogenase